MSKHLILLLVLCSSLYSIDTRSFLQVVDRSSIQSTAPAFQQYTLNLAGLRSQLKGRETVLENVPLSGTENVTLRLKATSSVFDQNTIFICPTAQGDKRCAAPDVRCYQGSIATEVGSEVSLVVSDAGLMCAIRRSNGQSISLSSDPKDPSQVLLAADRDLCADIKQSLQCAAPDLAQSFRKEHPIGILSTKLLELEVALETDSRFYVAAGGSLTKAQSYAIAVFTMANAIYEKEINVRLYLSWLKCWTDSPADPYNCGGDPFKLRDSALSYWETHYSTVPRDVYHVMTYQANGGGGYGYLDQLCKGKYAMASTSLQVQHTYPVYAFTYDTYIVAHELGHNLNAQHTHSCFFGYPLDTCLVADAVSGGCLASTVSARPNPGSIMSYCGGTNNGAGLGYQVRMTFLPQNIALMRAAAEAATCMTEPPKPAVAIYSPESSQSYDVHQIVPIRFRSSRVTNVDIAYSVDLGLHWKTIVANLAVDTGYYAWQAPNICSNNMRLRITSSTDSTVFDQSILPFHLYATAPAGLVAAYGFEGDFSNSICGGFDDAHIAEGQVNLTTDRFGLKDSAIAINGNGYLYVPSANLTSKALAVSLWCYADSLTGKNNLIGTNYGPATNVFEIYNWGILGCSYYIGTNLWQFWSSGLSTKTWTHVVFSYDGTTANTWVNNKLIKTEQHTGTLVPFTTSIYIGSRRGQEYFYGKLDDIKIYNRALDAADVQSLFTEKAAPTQPSIVLPPDQYLSPNKTVLCTWSTIANALQYQTQIASDVSFAANTIVLDTLTSDSAFVYHMPTTAAYYVRVRARNAFGISSYSAAHRFQQNPDDVREGSGVGNENCFVIRATENQQTLSISANNIGAQGCVVEVLNLLGQIVLQQSFNEISTEGIILHCETLPAAMYVVRVTNNSCKSAQRVLFSK